MKGEEEREEQQPEDWKACRQPPIEVPKVAGGRRQPAAQTLGLDPPSLSGCLE